MATPSARRSSSSSKRSPKPIRSSRTTCSPRCATRSSTACGTKSRPEESLKKHKRCRTVRPISGPAMRQSFIYSVSPSAKLRTRPQSNGTYVTWSEMQPASCRFIPFPRPCAQAPRRPPPRRYSRPAQCAQAAPPCPCRPLRRRGSPATAAQPAPGRWALYT